MPNLPDPLGGLSRVQDAELGGRLCVSFVIPNSASWQSPYDLFGKALFLLCLLYPLVRPLYYNVTPVVSRRTYIKRKRRRKASSWLSIVDHYEQVLLVRHYDNLLSFRSQSEQLQFVLQPQVSLPINVQTWAITKKGGAEPRGGKRHKQGSCVRTSSSTSCTSCPELFTKFQIICANSSMPCDSPSSAAGASLEKEAAVDAFRAFAVCSASIWPLVLRIAPLALSSTMLALTPGFLPRRSSFSSRASCPFVWRRGH